MYQQISATKENLNKLHELLDNLLVNNSDSFSLNEVEKNSLYTLKCFISDELTERLDGKKPGKRLMITL